jgi:hypothetical protein
MLSHSHRDFTSIYYYETNKGSGAVGSCTKALVHQVVCEETLTLTRLDEKVPVGNILVPHGSTLTGHTSITVLDCTPVRREGVPGLLISLFVQEELSLNTPQGANFPLEFGFLFQQFAPLASVAGNAFEQLDCRIVSLAARNHLTLNDDGTFDQLLEITIQARLLREIEVQLPLNTPQFSARGEPARDEPSSRIGLGMVSGLLLAVCLLGTLETKRSATKPF